MSHSLTLPRSGEVVIFDLEWTAWEGDGINFHYS